MSGFKCDPPRSRSLTQAEFERALVRDALIAVTVLIALCVLASCL